MRDLPHLENLNLARTGVTAAGIGALGDHPSLRLIVAPEGAADGSAAAADTALVIYR